MPNYILSRTSPPAHIYQRKIDLGYGVKVDTSDAPQPQKEKKMNDVKEVLDVAEQPVAAQPVNGQTVVDGNLNDNVDAERIRREVKAKQAEEVQKVHSDDFD